MPEEYTQAQYVNAMAQIGVRMLNRGAETEGDREAIRGAILMLQPSSPPEQVAKGIDILNRMNQRIRQGIYAVDRTAADEYEAERKRLAGTSEQPTFGAPSGATQIGH
jgi:hypothetical protein